MAETVTIIEEVNGEIVEFEERISSTTFQVKVDGQLYSPAIVQNVEIENDPDNANPKDQCGNVERQRAANSGWLMRVKGIVTKNDDRHGNLSLQMLRDVIAGMDEVKVLSDIFSGTIVISNIVITDSADLVSVITQDTHGEEDAYTFQLQLGEKNSQ